MTKEIYISSTPHETRLALVENDQLAEIYYERENEYTLAGSIYKGRVTRVLPGMQSAFVDVGLERDAFLYVTDFIEETEEGDDFTPLPHGQQQAAPALTDGAPQSPATRPEGTRDGGNRNDRNDRNDRRGRGGRGRGGRNRSGAGGDRRHDAPLAAPSDSQAEPGFSDFAPDFAVDMNIAEVGPLEENSFDSNAFDPNAAPSATQDEQGARRWRGRRGRRRGQDRGQGQERNTAGRAPESSHEDAAPVAHLHEQPLVAESAPSGQEFRSESRSSGRPPRRDRDDHRTASREASYDAPSGATPLVLPGESLSKYRRGGEPAAAAASAPTQSAPATPAKPSAIPTYRPSTMVEAPLAWDGGLQLPGESLSRHRNRPAPVAVAEPDQESTAHHLEPLVAPVSEPTSEPISEPILDTTGEPTTPPPAAEPVSTTEYEPTDADSASYRVDPITPSAYRHVAEPDDVREEVAEVVVEVAPPVPEQAHAPLLQNEEQLDLDDESFDDESSDDENSGDAAHLHAFSPGSGVLEEELIDDEEADFSPSYALLDDNELDDLVEETLDSQMDGSLLSEIVRDMHVEKRTRFQEDPNGAADADVNDVDDEEAEEISGESATEAGDFTEEDFSGEDSEDAEDSDESDDALADGSSEAGAADGAPRTAPSRSGSRNRGRQGGNNNRRRPGGGRPGQGGGHGRRASAQLSNLPAIAELLKSGQEILVQIAKEPIARKGARITSHIALPGRFLVFMPTVNHVGVSRKISSDEDRQRLKRILISEKGDASGGFIVRTAAGTASEEDLRADIRFLLNLWVDIRTRSETCKPPALIYHDLSLVERVLRDQVSENFSTIWVDTEADYERVLRFLQRFQPSLIRRVKLYTKETPLFEQFGIQEEINKALHSKVWLKSGGSIVINQTEALVAIDINTGKYVGKTARLEDTILKTNLDAIPEIVRQIRLRDLGGIIVIDFIDMDERKNRHRVMQVLEEELKSDRAPSKVLQFNDFGLVAITRKRVKQSLERTLSTQCEICSGTGMVKSPITVCNEIYIELRKMHRHLERPDIMLRVHPEVVKMLKSNSGHWLGEMEELSGKTVIVKSDPSLHPEQYDIH